MIADLVARLVGFARRHAPAVAVVALLLTGAAGWYAAGHLSVNSDIDRMLPSEPPWRQQDRELDRLFPQNMNLLAIVVDGRTGDLADAAAARLSAALQGQPQLFRHVRQPDGGPFFDRNGLLFLPKDELQAVATQLIDAQPLLGSLAHDPSLRGLFGALTLFVEGVENGATTIDKLNPTLAALARSVRGVLDGRAEPLSWQQLTAGDNADPRPPRRFVLTQPVLDYGSLEPGTAARDAVRRLAGELGLDAAHGVRVRMTGPVALDDEQFATLREGALRSTILSVVSVVAILFVALRSLRLVAAILATLLAGLVATGGFAAIAVGSLNLISVAFGVLFIGLAVDFSIQFCIRYRDQRHRHGTLEAALAGAARSIGPSLLLAAAATAIGFLSFVPTAYVGVRELGWIAGIGMLIAIALNLSLMPSLLTLLRPKGEPEPVGFGWAAPLDRLLLAQRRAVTLAAAAVAAAGLALLPRVAFDFDPLHLKNPQSESVATVLDLMKDPATSPYAAQVLAPSLDAATALAARLGDLPEVAQVLTAASYIPTDQAEKLPIVEDLALLLGPSLSPAATLPPPTDTQTLTALAACRDALHRIAAAHDPAGPAEQLSQALGEAVARGSAIVEPLRETMLGGLLHRIGLLRELMQAQPVDLASLPAELRDGWIAADGRARIEVFLRGDARDNAVLERFVAAIRRIAPDATGSPVTIQEAGRLISGAFVEAGIIAVSAIVALLALVLRRVREVALVVAPLLLAALLTLATTVIVGMPLNYANIIALPLLLGIGVAFDIYFVMNWRAGVSQHLQSSTARAVVFSAFTTMTAFGSLALSDDPGTAGMGKLLTISLGWTLFCTLFVLPALLGPSPHPTR